MRRASPLDHSTPRVPRLPRLRGRPRHVCNRSNEALYRSLIERVPGIVYISQFGPNARWHLRQPSNQEYLGYAAEEWLANPSLWLQHVHPEDRELVLAEEQRLHKSGTAFFAEYAWCREDGRSSGSAMKA